MSISLAASPEGRRIGLIAVSGNDAQLLITVAPKPWRAGATQTHVIDDLLPGHTSLSLYEGDRLHLLFPRTNVDDMFGALLRTSAQAAGNELEWGTALLRPDVRPPVPQRTELPTGDAEQNTSDLLRLFQRVNLLLSPTPNLLSRAGRSRLHRPLARRQLLDEVERRIGQARRGYRNVVRDRQTVRGRVSSASVARHVATGSPVLRCRFDELTESTELMGVIAAALDVIAEGRGPNSFLPAPFDERGLRDDAVRLRRAMSEVSSTPVAQALWLGSRRRLNRIDQPWTRALRLAITELQDQEVVARSSSHRDFQAAELSVETDRVWEWIVNAALRRTVFDHVLVQGAEQAGLVVDPWLEHPLQIAVNTRPDNIALQRSRIFVVDAKYKLAQTPSRDDQYQMFAYSHLVQSEGRDVVAAVLVYPGTHRTARWLRGRDDEKRPVRLFSVHLPFPSRTDLASDGAWGRYLLDVGSRVGRELELVRPAD